MDGFDGHMRNEIVPCGVRHRRIRIAPTHHKRPMPLCHDVSDERVVWLQIKNIELVDTRGDQQKRFLVFFGELQGLF